MQEPVAQRFGFAVAQRRGEGEQPQPAGEVGGEGDEGQPCAVDAVFPRGEPAQAAVFGDPDAVFNAGVGPVPGFQERDLPGGGVGGEGLVAPP